MDIVPTNFKSDLNDGRSNKNKIIAISVIIFLVILSAVFIIFTINKINKSDVVQIEKDACGCQNSISTDCVKEGEYVGHPDKDSFECCPDLSKIDARPLDDDCAPIIPEGGSGMEPGWICINCGDGICNDKANENMCNCPEDCSAVKSCVKEDGYVDHPDKNSFECCNGLVKVSSFPLDDNCQPDIMPNSPGPELGWACINCGDGECSGQYENKCNCPEDCGNDLSQSQLIYKQEAFWGPCSNPEGGCWEKVYLYSDGAVNTETKSGTVSQSINIGEVGVIIEYIRSSGLLTDKCEYDPVLDLAKYYSLSLDGINKKITFPGCETKLNQLDDLIEAASLDILSGESITVKAQKGLYEYLARNDKYSLDILELTLENFIELCRYDEAGNPIEEDSCWPLRYPGRSLKEKIMNIEPELETLYHVSFSYNSKHLIGCGLDGGLVLISDRGRIFKTEERKLCIEN